MLPAIELPLKPGVGHRFTRRPDWVAPCESLWGMLSKWQFVNRLPYTTAATAIFARPVALTDTGVDLRVSSAFDLNALARHSGISAATLAGGACGCSPEARVLAITSDYLRYCSACMQVGYHAALFQFRVIARCPIHLQRLRGACPHCKRRIPYRLDPSFLAKPFACPHCAHPWLHEPRVLARHHWEAAPMDAILRWQRYLGIFAFWYAEGARPLRDDKGQFIRALGSRRPIMQALGFIARLQQRLSLPPPLPLVSRGDASPPSISPRRNQTPTQVEPRFTRVAWPHFHRQSFMKLYQRYEDAARAMQQRDVYRSQPVTPWWRRSWEGVLVRSWKESSTSRFPPFGIAEWLAFAPHPVPRPKPGEPYRSLEQRFEQDLLETWEAWRELIDDGDPRIVRALHPHLVPPRACWLKQPSFEPGTPALGFF